MNEKTFFLLLIATLLFVTGISCAQPLSDYRWTTIDATGEAKGRHENAFVEYNASFICWEGGE